MRPFVSKRPKYLALFLIVLLMSGCSSSSDGESDGVSNGSSTAQESMQDGAQDTGSTTASNVETSTGTTAGTTTAGSTTDATTGATTDETAPSNQTTTRIDFDITVPVYVSNELQVRISYGEKDIVAVWNSDEFWTASESFPSETNSPLVVTFSDRNGGITLASAEQTLTTGTESSQLVRITADQFEIQRWDSDNDGVSNLDELIDGTDPLVEALLLPVQTTLQLVSDKTYRISWQPTAGAQFYRVMENPDGVSGFSLISDELDENTLSFDHRVALYNRTSARYLVQACNTITCVDSTEVAVSGTLWNAVGYIKASNTESFDNFGSAVSLSADGSTLAVAAYGEDSSSTGIDGNQNDNAATASGAVYVFVRSDGVWQQQAYLKASNAEKQDLFGYFASMSISDNGDTLVVGASADQSGATGINGDQNDNSVGRSGAAYVFTRTNATWEQQAYIKASNTGEVDRFGVALSLSGDGTRLAIGASTEDSAAVGINGDQDNDSAPDSGAVYLFDFNDGVWQQNAYLKASNARAWREFGSSVSLSSDGNTLAVGSPREDSSSSGINGNQIDDSFPNAGAVYVFSYNSGNWQQQAYIKASNPGVRDAFGRTVSLSANGDTLAVGANFEDSNARGVNANQLNNTLQETGAVYLFDRNGDTWRQQAYLKASNTDLDDRFGGAISLSADGNTLAVGAAYEDSHATGINSNQSDNSGEDAGAVYLFARNNDDWQQRAYIKASNTDAFDYFGTSVSLSADGETLAVGALEESSSARGIQGNQADDSVRSSGAVYLY